VTLLRWITGRQALLYSFAFLSAAFAEERAFAEAYGVQVEEEKDRIAVQREMH
jgi:hypothetical protein